MANKPNIKEKQYCNEFNKDFKNDPQQKTNLKKKKWQPVQVTFLVMGWLGYSSEMSKPADK